MTRRIVRVLIFAACFLYGSRSMAVLMMEPAPALPIELTPTTQAINYELLGGSLRIHLRGTSLLPHVEGDALVRNRPEGTHAQIVFSGLVPAARLGPEYLTYVVWAVSPEGAAINLGELIPRGTACQMTVTTRLRVFALIVTAEPYFAVSKPSAAVVIEGDSSQLQEKATVPIEIKYEGSEDANVTPVDLRTLPADPRTPPHLLQARRALQIAAAAGAEATAPDVFGKAHNLWNEAEDDFAIGKSRAVVEAEACAAIEATEEVRLITVQRREQKELENALLKSEATDRQLMREEAGKSVLPSDSGQSR